MKKLFLFFVILLFLAVGRLDILASPNTGKLPDGCIKIEFSPLNYPEGWLVTVGEEQTTLVKDSVTLTLFDFTYKDQNEVIGFSWMLEGASAEFWVKHGQTEAQYGGQFVTSDRKGVSNAVWCLTIDEVVDEDPEEDPDDEVDEEDPEDEPDDEIDEEDPDDEPEDEIDEEDPEDEPEDEVEGDDDEEPEDPVGDGGDDPLPDLGATGIATGLITGLLGLFGLFITRKN